MDEFNAFVDSLGKQVQEFFKEFSEGPSFQDQVLAFVHAIDWTEPWIITLLATHATLLLLVLLTRKRETLQFGIFIAGVLLVWSAEYLNAWGAIHWRRFSKQDYFDKSGLFVSVVFSGPILVVNIIILVQAMVSLIQAMFKWKRAELKHRARQAAKAAGEKTD